MVLIFLDDVRYFNPAGVVLPEDCEFQLVRNANAAIAMIDFYSEHNTEIWVDFDHDLGMEKSGYDVAKWIVENRISNLKFHIHSMNPVGAANIHQLLTTYGYEEYEYVRRV